MRITAAPTLAAGGFRLAATCLDVSLEGPCEGSVDQPGVLTVPASRLLEMAKALPGAEIRIWTDDKGAVRLKAGTYASRLQALPPEDFPAMPVPEGPVTDLPREALRRGVAQVRYAVGSSDTRYLLAGAQLALGDGTLTLCATDSHRIAVATAPLPGGAAQAHIVPARALDQVAALIAEPGDGPVGFSEAGNHLFFAIDGRVLAARKVDGKFPAWQRIVPKDNAHVATIDRAALRTAINRVTLVSTGRTRTITLKFAPGALEVAAVSTEVGEATEALAIAYAGPAMDVSVQSEYLLDYLVEAAAAEVVLALKSAQAAMLLTAGPDYLGVIMPVSL